MRRAKRSNSRAKILANDCPEGQMMKSERDTVTVHFLFLTIRFRFYDGW